VDVVVAVTPYYLKPTPEELVEHYVEVCRAVHLPMMAYNFPWHGGVELLPETLAQVAARCENLVGIKDSSGKLETAVSFRNCVPGRELAVFVGGDHLITSALQRGCAGALTGCVNVAPRLFVELYRAFVDGRISEAERLQSFASELGEAHGLHTFPSVMKEAMRMAGMPAGVCRRPVGPVPEWARQRLSRIVGRLTDEGFLPQPPKMLTV
jgi:4-hydroxy-tetrahydrodipicolinate synthase